MAGPARQSQSAVRVSGAPPRARRELLPLLMHPRSKRGRWQCETGTACSSGIQISSLACSSGKAWKAKPRLTLGAPRTAGRGELVLPQAAAAQVQQARSAQNEAQVNFLLLLPCSYIALR